MRESEGGGERREEVFAVWGFLFPGEMSGEVSWGEKKNHLHLRLIIFLVRSQPGSATPHILALK